MRLWKSARDRRAKVASKLGAYGRTLPLSSWSSGLNGMSGGVRPWADGRAT